VCLFLNRAPGHLSPANVPVHLQRSVHVPSDRPSSVLRVEQWLVAPHMATPDRRDLAAYIAWRAITEGAPPVEAWLFRASLALAHDVLTKGS
jgi:hypothetical protein